MGKAVAVESSSPESSQTTTFIRRRISNLMDTAGYVRELAVETGLVDAEWLAHPLEGRPDFTPPLEVLRRFVERLVEDHPSVLGQIGLRAVELWAWDAYWNRREGLHTPEEVNGRAVVVFTDLEGFTQYTSDVGDEQARETLADHLSACMPIIRRGGGRVVKRLGDGLMLAFGEEATALRVAVELLDTAPKPLRVRAGVHAGDVIILADDLIGQTVNVAARVADRARPGEVLATDDVVSKAGDLADLTVRPDGHESLKGLDAPVPVNRVTAHR